MKSLPMQSNDKISSFQDSDEESEPKQKRQKLETKVGFVTFLWVQNLCWLYDSAHQLPYNQTSV
jgi:hypothetical protein